MSDRVLPNSLLQLPANAASDSAVRSAVVGVSDWTVQIRRDIQSVARHASSVLISGPNGTGKEILARAIHAHSPRRDRPFIPVDCAAFVGELFPSHMFGHVKGSFTGANYESMGCIRAAHGGTLFLDEIGELEPALQVKLLRVLQERVVVPVGGIEGTPVDIRLICATNRDLHTEVMRGNFRQDLFYRLNVVQLRTTPLSERAADIVVLADHFLDMMANETGVPRKVLSSPAQVLLTAYPWPGNVRQLKNILERAVVFAESDEIEASLLAQLLYEEQTPVDYGYDLRPFREAAPASAFDPRHEQSHLHLLPQGDAEVLLNHYEDQSNDIDAGDAWVSLASLERMHILRTLEHTGFNQTEAARLLQTTCRILAGKIKRYGIDVSLSRRGRPAKSGNPGQPR